jgi:hypothetical protein
MVMTLVDNPYLLLIASASDSEADTINHIAMVYDGYGNMIAKRSIILHFGIRVFANEAKFRFSFILASGTFIGMHQ